MTPAEIKAILLLMNNIANMYFMFKVTVININDSEGIGYSIYDDRKKTAIIGINLGLSLPGLSKREKKLIFFGVLTHEMLHLWRTNFDLSEKLMSKYPMAERRDRHTIVNVVEDPAIEFQRHPELSDFLNKALDFTIWYFYKKSDELGSQPTAYTEVICALIQFGDIGAIRGSFKFDESKEAFLKVIPIMSKAIESEDFSDRFSLSMDIFEILKPLWIEHNKLANSNSLLNSLLEALGKNEGKSSGKSTADPNDGSSPSDAAENTNKRRKKTIHLIDEEDNKDADDTSSNNGNSQDADDIYISETQDETKGTSDISDILDPDTDYDIVDERKNPELKKNPDEDNTSSENNIAGSSKDNSSDDKTSESKDDKNSSGSNDSSKSDEDNSNQASGSSNDSAKDDKPFDENTSDGAKDTDSADNASSQGSPNTDKTKSGSASDNADDKGTDGFDESNYVKPEDSADSVDTKSLTNSDSSDIIKNTVVEDGSNQSTWEKIGEEIEKLSKEIEDEINNSDEFAATNEILDDLEARIQRQTEISASEELRIKKELSVNDIDVSVPSPYYGEQKYTNQTINNDNLGYVYDTILHDSEINSYIVNLKSGFKKIFKDKAECKEYKTSGRVDVARLTGRKITPRMFYKKKRPDNKTDMAMLILIDESGSMSSAMQRVKETLVVLLESLKPFGVKVKIVGFSSGRESQYFHYGKGDWKLDDMLIKSCMNIKGRGGTFLGHALRYSGVLLKKRPETHKFFVCITDGDPCHSVYKSPSEGANDCRSAIQEIHKYASCVGVGLYYDEQQEDAFRYIFMDGCVSMSNLDNLVRELPSRIKTLMK
jgi:hypothetical protein